MIENIANLPMNSLGNVIALAFTWATGFIGVLSTSIASKRIGKMIPWPMALFFILMFASILGIFHYLPDEMSSAELKRYSIYQG